MAPGFYNKTTKKVKTKTVKLKKGRITLPSVSETGLARSVQKDEVHTYFSEIDFRFKLIILGDSAVGKSSLMQRVTKNEFLEEHKVTEGTMGIEFGTLVVKLESHVFGLQIWDPAVQESFK